MSEFCTYPACKCIIGTSTTNPVPECPQDLIRPAAGLPEYCFTVIQTQTPGNRIAIIKRGDQGYYLTDVDNPKDSIEMVEQAVRHFNSQRGLTEAQVTAMEIGSMRGWHVPGADPARVQKGMDDAAARRADDKRRRA